ncbi:long-chain fatty acid--CoA ligase [Micromonospora sp. NBRC 101691]|uniref:AMP-dependent synthetase/ligase n=1 Tax=Micromonospora sp. NBRC 101691 TaxID=3032198 RepID=UPI0024A1C29B|nr:long-chain fatty acid--CoA ligase [Micromonospora sp. NBRC 101691]GLY24692.1 long-chain acyl-CoA synthetase [Micromonospora sp. NBRC 101691]
MDPADTLADRCAKTAAELTVPALLHRNATEFADLPALTTLDRDDTRTWAELRDEVAELSGGLAEIGLQPGGHMLIMMSSRPEHWLVDLAATHLGAVPCTVYPTLSTDQLRYLALHSGAQVLVLEGANELARWRSILPDLPHLRRIVLVDAAEPDDLTPKTVPLSQVRAIGQAAHQADPDAFERRWRAIRPEQPVTLLYTSGTTGDPKGVVLSHHNVIYQAVVLEATVSVPDHAPSVAYLPLAHIAERILGIYNPIYRAGHVTICPDPTQLIRALRAIGPPSFFGVPRIWEKMAAGIEAHLATAEPAVQAAFNAASAVALEAYELRAAGQAVPDELAARVAQAEATVLRPLQSTLGLQNVVWAGSGAAPIPVDVLRFLAGLGVDVLEVWGMTETTGTATINTPERFRTGTVGRPNAGMQVRLADDGEILVRGPLVCSGYLRGDGSIEPVVDADGWLATGDVGTIDEDGFLSITDRKKELIITSSGKNISPAHIEGLLRAHPLIGQAVAIGDRRPYVTALIVLDDEVAPLWARARGISDAQLPGLASDPLLLAEIQAVVDAANAKLARPEQVKTFEVLPSAWTPESGELTPTLKLRRRVIVDRYHDSINALYQSPGAV